MAFAKLPSNGRKGSGETEGGGKSDQCDRFMPPPRPGSMEPTQASTASCDGIQPASVVGGTLGTHYRRLNVSLCFPTFPGVVDVGQGVVFGWGLLWGSTEQPLLDFRIRSVEPSTMTRILKYHLKQHVCSELPFSDWKVSS